MMTSSFHTNPSARCLAVLGTGSEVGKSVVATALCRTLVQKGIRVAPFKAQNMSNNSGVTTEGLEMGRAQIVQAEAAGIPPHVDMNPILLKPTSDLGAQVVVMGKVAGNQEAERYFEQQQSLFATAAEAYDRLAAAHDLIVMEGAGSCAEVNLMDRDIVNFRMAEHAGAAVILVADIHKGGVFAQIIGTLACISQQQRDMIKGIIINRFRGDARLFEQGRAWIEEKTGKKVLGVLPWYDHFLIEAEDSVSIENPAPVPASGVRAPAVAVIRLPHISNFTDFNPLLGLDGLQVHFLEKVQTLYQFNAVILPGSKNTRHDLDWLHKAGWSRALLAYAAGGGHVLGICGGYQMMGQSVSDPDGLEGPPGDTQGLGLLPMETVFQDPKTTTQTRFQWGPDQGVGYEIHMGRTRIFTPNPWFKVLARNNAACEDQEGLMGKDSRSLGTYIHGLFDSPDILRRWLEYAGMRKLTVAGAGGLVARDRAYDLLAEHFKCHVDLGPLMPG